MVNHICLMKATDLKMIKVIIIFILLFEKLSGNFAVQMKNFNGNEEVMILKNEFQMLHPTVLTLSKNIKLMRNFFSKDNFVKAITNVNPKLSLKSHQNLIFFANSMLSLQDIQSVLIDYEFALLIFQSDSQFDYAYQFLEIEINQNICLYKMTSQELFESYQINNRKTKQKLGNVDQITKKFVWEDGINSDFITRRSNFHGLILKGPLVGKTIL